MVLCWYTNSSTPAQTGTGVTTYENNLLLAAVRLFMALIVLQVAGVVCF